MMIFRILFIFMIFYYPVSLALALSSEELTASEQKDFETNWKPIEVFGGAIPWKIFAETKSLEICKTDKDGYDNCTVEPSYSNNVMALNGKEVTIMGFMFPLDQSEGQRNFLIGPYPLSCPYHYHIGPENVIEVFANEGIEFSYDPVTVKGTLSVRYNEETGVFYYLENARLP